MVACSRFWLVPAMNDTKHTRRAAAAATDTDTDTDTDPLPREVVPAR
jgi:hypothetical protein